MNIQYDTRVLSSLALFVDYKLLKVGQAYTNYSSPLYPISSDLKGLYGYSTPYKQLVNDLSITGANIMTGVYLDGSFITPGQSGLYGINHYNGVVYFNREITNPTTRLSGVYAFKDFSVKITDQTDYKLLFGNKYIKNQPYYQKPTGIEEDVEVYPIIYVRPTTVENRPWCFGGVDDNIMIARCVIIAEDMYSVLGAANILKNTNLKELPIYASLPFNQMGLYTGTPYNYEQLSRFSEGRPLIWKVRTSSVAAKGDDFNLLNKKTMFVDFEIRSLGSRE